MATAEAVAAVGLSLRSLLADRVQDPAGGSAPVPVNLGAPGPDRDPDGAVDEARINLFLYRVSENGYLRNQEIPGHGHPSAYGRPPLSLDLCFLLTVYGSRMVGTYLDETPAHQLLGSAMQVLHDNAVITDSLVTRRPPAGQPILDPVLRKELETLKVTLHPLGIEDLTNVWTALELSFRLSVAYEVSVVRIESDRPRKHAPLIGEFPPPGQPHRTGPRVITVPLRQPRLSSIGVRRADDPSGLERTVPFARVGDTLVLHGNQLSGGGVAVRIGSTDVPASYVAPSGEVIEAEIPDHPLLTPGTHTTAVATVVPELPQAAMTTVGLPIVIVPHVSVVSVVGRTLAVQGTRLLDGAAPAEILVGDTVVPRTSYLPGSTATSVEVSLADTLPAFPVTARVSGTLAPFPSLPASFDLTVQVGTQTPRDLTLHSTPTSLREAATAIQAAVIDTPNLDPVRVAATNRALVLIPGDLTSSISVAPGQLADALRLSHASQAREVYLSGALTPFPVLTAAVPMVRVSVGAETAEVTLGVLPSSVAEAARELEAGLRTSGFADVDVAVIGDQLCVVPTGGGSVELGPVPGADETTAAELGLAGAYPVRARVRGVESIDDRPVVLP
jgi:hypothetical protein